MSVENLFLGRQPILNRDQHLVAFELLFRSSRENGAGFTDGFVASATVITHVFNELGVEEALGSCLGFINLDEALIMSDIVEFMPKAQVVLEILETVQITPELVERCRELKSQGFTLALDDFVHFGDEAEAIMPHVDIVKVDIAAVDPSQLESLVGTLRKWPAKLLAEKVETRAEFKRCLDLGFHLFQGYYFAKPEVITGKRLAHSEIQLMKLLEKVNADAESHEIEQMLKEDALLSYNLLRIANSASSGARQQITSVKAALALIGRRQLQRWVQLLLYTSSGASYPNPLLQLAATRGKLMELLSENAFGKNAEDSAFMTGVMSLLDVLLGMPLQEILASIDVDPEVKAALIGYEGELGSLLRLVHAMEGAEEIPDVLVAFPEITLHELNLAQSAALAWANGLREA